MDGCSPHHQTDLGEDAVGAHAVLWKWLWQWSRLEIYREPRATGTGPDVIGDFLSPIDSFPEICHNTPRSSERMPRDVDVRGNLAYSVFGASGAKAMNEVDAEAVTA